MKRLSTFLFGLTLLGPAAQGQNTPEALGEIVFACFQQNDLDRFYSLLPSFAEVAAVGTAIGMDTASVQYRDFVKGYPLAIANFKEKCADLRTDTTDLNFSWTTAKLDSIHKSVEILRIDKNNPKGKTVTVAIVDIYFVSNDKRLKLTLGDTNSYGGIWKPGNNIRLVKLPKRH